MAAHPHRGPALLALLQDIPPCSSCSSFHQIHQDPEHQNDDEAGWDQLAAVPAGGDLPPAHVHQHHSGDRQATAPPGPRLVLLSVGTPVPRLAGHGGFCPSSRARTGQGCFLPTLLPSGDGCPPAGPLVPRISLSPPSPRVCLQDPCPIRGVLVDEPRCPASGSWHRGRGQPQAWRGAPSPCQLLPAPWVGRVKSYCSVRAGGSPPAL